jgi:hypothetical protein
LTSAQISRLAQASKSDATVHIVTQDELKTARARPERRER